MKPPETKPLRTTPVTLAIIGTAGRKGDGPRLDADPNRYLERMQAAALKVAELCGATELVSGGAAWADHIAVMLFLAHPTRFTLRLELPAPLVPLAGGGLAFEDTGVRDFVANPGGTSNHYHENFGRSAFRYRGRSPRDDFAAIQGNPRVSIQVTPGLFARNKKVALADHCLAMTFGEGRALKDGGTANTMSAFCARPDRGRAFHLDLSDCRLYRI